MSDNKLFAPVYAVTATDFVLLSLAAVALYYLFMRIASKLAWKSNNQPRMQNSTAPSINNDNQKRPFKRSELREFNGSDPAKQILLAVKGTVYDVSRAKNFYGPGASYNVFAGRDASRGLAKGSFADADLNNSNLDDLTPEEKQTLNQWADSYSKKYPVVGFIVDEAAAKAPSKNDPKAL